MFDLKLKFSDMRGVIVPIDGKAAYKKCFDSAIYDLFPKEYVGAAYLSALGAAYKYSQEKTLKCETIFLSGSSVDYFTDEDLTNLFKNNKIILEGGCALKIEEGVGTYAYKTNNGYVLMFVNGNVDTFEKTEFYARDNFKGIKIIRRDGSSEKADFTLEGDNKIIIDEPLEYLSTTVLVGEL